MMNPELSCGEEHRRDEVRAASLFGLDYAEVDETQRTVTVYFLGKAPQGITKANIAITGGTRTKDVQVVNLRVQHQTDPTLDEYMEVSVNQPGDFSSYTLRVVQLDERGNPTSKPFPGFDPRYGGVDFTFKASCPSDLDCQAPCSCPPPQRSQPDINYLAKDYASFRQLILDRLALIAPNWKETHVPDLGITLVELLAYAGDYLSYYQDAVATEAYLDTARERISVRRHARLVDYAMHEGCNARAWVTLETDSDQQFERGQIYFTTAYSGAPENHVLDSTDLEFVPVSSYETFEVLWPKGDTISIYAAHNEIAFYTWGDCQCCLAKGATSATLVDTWVVPSQTGGDGSGNSGTPAGGTPPAILKSRQPSSAGSYASAQPAKAAAKTNTNGDPAGAKRALQLKPGDVLIFEERIGPKTANTVDANPTHRQAVRLTKVTATVDPLYHPDPNHQDYGQPLVEIEWAPQDALTFTLCISAQAPPQPPDPDIEPCSCMDRVSVARGNVVLVDHGAGGSEEIGTVPTHSTTERCPTPCEPAGVDIEPDLFRPALAGVPLTFSQPIPAGACSAAEMIVQDPRQALPAIWLEGIPPAPECAQGAMAPCSIPSLFTFGDLVDPRGLATTLKQPDNPNSQFLAGRLQPATVQMLAAWDGTSELPDTLRAALVADLSAQLQTWNPLSDLLESAPGDRMFVAEMDNDGYAHLRFGDGQLGRMPDAGMGLQAIRRLGNGTAGNVGAESILYLVLRNEKLSGVRINPRNPLPATGGTDPEPLAEVKMFAPHAFRDVLERAITADDYATLAADNARRQEERYAALNARHHHANVCEMPFRPLQAAKATLRWTGSWYEVLVAVDPADSESADETLLREVREYLEPYRRIGYDLEVRGAEYIPLDLALAICVQPTYLRGHVEAALLDVFSNRVLRDGTLGFFHPDNLTFSDGIYVSRIVAAAQAVAGVQTVSVTRLQRLDVGAPKPMNMVGMIRRAPLISHPTISVAPGSPVLNSDRPAINPRLPVIARLAAPALEVPSSGVLQLGPFEIARLDNDPNFPENGRLTLELRGGR